MDTICVYKDKLNEALTLVPSMSQAKRLEAVSYWNNAASHFQKLVNANSPTRDGSQALTDATGQNSSLEYQQQVSDINPTVIVHADVFGPRASNQVEPTGPHECMMEVNNDLTPTNGTTDQYQRQASLLNPSLYETEYYAANMIEGLQQQQQLSPGGDDINTLSTMCNPTAPQGPLMTMDAGSGNQQYQSSMQTTGSISMRPMGPRASSMSNIDNLSTEDSQVPDDGLMFCPMLDGSVRAVPVSSTTIGSSNLSQTGDQTRQTQVGPILAVNGSHANLTPCPSQATAIHDIGNGQFDRGPGLPTRTDISVTLAESRSDLEISFPANTDNMSHHRDDSYTQGARPLQQIQVFGQTSGHCDYDSDERFRGTPTQQRQQIAYIPDPALSVTPSCSSSHPDATSQHADPMVKQEASDASTCMRPSAEQHTCELCGKSGFSTKGNLKRHRKAHAGEKPYKCEHCESKFTEKKSLKIHLRRHTGEKPYKCTVCEKPFSQTGVLKSHMALHLEERKFNCDKCSKAFRQRSQLKLHLMRHDGIKKLECSRCMAKFLTKGDLERHFRIHTGERPYKCNMCEKTFTRQQSLNEHKNRHIGRKPFTCKICDKSFSEMSASYKHAKVHKKDELAQQLRNG